MLLQMRESIFMPNTACVRSQQNRSTKDLVFWLAQMVLCIMMLRNFLPFVQQTGGRYIS